MTRREYELICRTLKACRPMRDSRQSAASMHEHIVLTLCEALSGHDSSMRPDLFRQQAGISGYRPGNATAQE